MNKENKSKQLSFDYSVGVLKSAKATPRDNVYSMRDRVERGRDRVDRDLYKRIVSRTKHL